MALHLGYRFYPQVAGVLVMSSFLYSNSSVYKVCLLNTGKASQVYAKPSEVPPPAKWARDDKRVQLNVK